jgi:hypothetical protein
MSAIDMQQVPLEDEEISQPFNGIECLTPAQLILFEGNIAKSRDETVPKTRRHDHKRCAMDMLQRAIKRNKDQVGTPITLEENINLLTSDQQVTYHRYAKNSLDISLDKHVRKGNDGNAKVMLKKAVERRDLADSLDKMTPSEREAFHAQKMHEKDTYKASPEGVLETENRRAYSVNRRVDLKRRRDEGDPKAIQMHEDNTTYQRNHLKHIADNESVLLEEMETDEMRENYHREKKENSCQYKLREKMKTARSHGDPVAIEWFRANKERDDANTQRRYNEWWAASDPVRAETLRLALEGSDGDESVGETV